MKNSSKQMKNVLSKIINSNEKIEKFDEYDDDENKNAENDEIENI